MTNNPDLEIPEIFQRKKAAPQPSSMKDNTMPVNIKEKSDAKAVTAQLTTAQNAEVLPPNAFSDIAAEIEKLPDGQAALSRVEKLVAAQGLNAFELGGVLSLMRRKKWFCGYDSLEVMCLREFGFAKSKAYDLVRVYDVLIEAELSWDDFEEVGISKLRLLCRNAVKSGEQQDDKVDLAKFSVHAEKAKSMNYVELQNYLDALALPAPVNDEPLLGHEESPPPQEDGPTNPGPEPEDDQIKATTFKDVDPQAPSQAAAIEEQLVHLFEKMDAARILELFEQVFPDIDIKVTLPDENEEAP